MTRRQRGAKSTMNTIYRPTLLTPLLAVLVCACNDAPLPSTAEPPSAAAPQPEQSTASEPDVATMTLAAPVESGKIGVPVEVRYLLAGVAARNQPAPLDLAFVPSVEGSNLEVTFLESEVISIDAGAAPLIAARAGTANIHRRRLTVTPRAADGGQIRVQVAMDVAGGRYSSIFVLPVARATAATGVVR